MTATTLQEIKNSLRELYLDDARPFSCHSEPFATLKGKLREESRSDLLAHLLALQEETHLQLISPEALLLIQSVG